MIAHVLLIYLIYLLISRRRVAAVKAGHAKASQFRENQDEPAESLFVRNNLENQFELPMLFYPCCLALFVTGGTSFLTVALAWLFVLSRYGHAFIHVTTNRLRHRYLAFVFGLLTLGVMWSVLALHLTFGIS